MFTFVNCIEKFLLDYPYFCSIANACSYDAQNESLFVQYKELEHFIQYSIANGIKPQLIGRSEEERAIYQLRLGNGKRKVLIWSQMHGNESTGTMASFDMIAILLKSQSPFVKSFLNSLTIFIIPMLNPDGAELWTRENASGIDLNRDALDLKTKESKILRQSLEGIQPDFCLNLHDQRSIFNVSGTFNPAVLSFLSPSVNKKRTITNTRLKSMQVIHDINQKLQTVIPNCIGRYSDEYYPNATGDVFQTMGIPTVLFEAGWMHSDNQKQMVRHYFLYAMILALESISSFQLQPDIVSKYNSIPQNDKKLFDMILRNTLLKTDDEKKEDIGIQKEIIWEDGQWKHRWWVKKIGNLSAYRGYKEIDCKGRCVEKAIKEEEFFPFAINDF